VFRYAATKNSLSIKKPKPLKRRRIDTDTSASKNPPAYNAGMK